MKECKHCGCAVCKRIEERKVFESIYQTKFFPIYVCEHAMYAIKNSRGEEFIINSLGDVSKNKTGYYVHDLYTFMLINLTKNNVRILCAKEGICELTPYVAEK